MATSNMTFADWQTNSNASLMTTAEELLDKLEDTSELLAEIDQKFIVSQQQERSNGSEEEGEEDQTSSVIQRFHEGVDSARDLVNMLKREKWRLNKRQMSVEMTMGELEDYKRHLKNDVSSLNQTVEALSLRVIQVENELAEAQEVREGLEAELDQHRNTLLAANDRNVQLYSEKEDLKQVVQDLQKSRVQQENQRLQDEVHVLTLENRKLKDMVRDAEAKCPPFMQRSPPPAPVGPRIKGGDLEKLRKEFLEELTSLELSQRHAAKPKEGGGGSGNSGGGGGGSSSSVPATLRKIPIVNVQADV